MTEPTDALNLPTLATPGVPEARPEATPCPVCGGEDAHQGTGFPGEEDRYICDSCEATFGVDEAGQAFLY